MSPLDAACHGAIFATDGATVTLANATIASNGVSPGVPGGLYGGGVVGGEFGTALGAGIYNDAATVTAANTLIADNGAVFYADISGDVFGPLTSLGYVLLEDPDGASLGGVATGNLLDVDPALAALASNGAVTETHALAADSPAVGAGRPPADGGCTDIDGAALTTDQRRAPRPGLAGTGCDIGAFELGPPGLPTCDGREPTFVGWDGDDVIYGLRGNDALCGGPGNDVLAGGGDTDIADFSCETVLRVPWPVARLPVAGPLEGAAPSAPVALGLRRLMQQAPTGRRPPGISQPSAAAGLPSSSPASRAACAGAPIAA